MHATAPTAIRWWLGCGGLGFATLLADEWLSPIITTFHAPADPAFEFDAFYDAMKARGFIIYPGKLTAVDSFRLGHIGQMDSAVMARVVAAVADSMAALGVGDCRPCPRSPCRRRSRMTKFKAVVFDWAGTMIDFGSFAPMGVFVEAFKRFGLDATIAEARAPMGAPKRDHIKAMLMAPRMAAQWEKLHGTAPTEADIDRIYAVFVPMNEKVVADYATLVPGAAVIAADLRARGLKIGFHHRLYAVNHGTGLSTGGSAKATRPTIASAPMTCPKVAPARCRCIRHLLIWPSTRPRPSSRWTIPNRALPRASRRAA